ASVDDRLVNLKRYRRDRADEERGTAGQDGAPVRDPHAKPLALVEHRVTKDWEQDDRDVEALLACEGDHDRRDREPDQRAPRSLLALGQLVDRRCPESDA